MQEPKKRPHKEDSEPGPNKKIKVDHNQEFIEANSDPVRYHCDYCRKDLSQTPRIQCAVCKPEFDLCIQCFCVGVELRGHKNWHDYRVIENLHVPFWSTDWGADEEILLLEGLELYGMGNWVDISDYVSTKDKDECRDHFNTFYINTPNWPTADFSTVISDKSTIQQLNSGHHCRLHVPKPVKIPVPEKKPKPKAPPNLAKPELNGYIPMREEFDIDWDKDCEKHVAALDFEEDDDEFDIDYKMGFLEVYNYRIRERDKMTKFAVEKRLHDTKLQETLAKNRTKEEKILYNEWKKFLQVMTPEEHNEFISGEAAEEVLTKKVRMLQECRRKGATTLSEAHEYQKEKPKKEAQRIKRYADRMKTFEFFCRSNALSHQETLLCSELGIRPEEYLQSKLTLFQEYLTNGGEITKAAALQVTKLNDSMVSKLFSLFQLFNDSWENENDALRCVSRDKQQISYTTAPMKTITNIPQQQYQQQYQPQQQPQQYQQQYSTISVNGSQYNNTYQQTTQTQQPQQNSSYPVFSPQVNYFPSHDYLPQPQSAAVGISNNYYQNPGIVPQQQQPQQQQSWGIVNNNPRGYIRSNRYNNPSTQQTQTQGQVLVQGQGQGVSFFGNNAHTSNGYQNQVQSSPNHVYPPSSSGGYIQQQTYNSPIQQTYGIANNYTPTPTYGSVEITNVGYNEQSSFYHPENS